MTNQGVISYGLLLRRQIGGEREVDLFPSKADFSHFFLMNPKK